MNKRIDEEIRVIPSTARRCEEKSNHFWVDRSTVLGNPWEVRREEHLVSAIEGYKSFLWYVHTMPERRLNERINGMTLCSLSAKINEDRKRKGVDKLSLYIVKNFKAKTWRQIKDALDLLYQESLKNEIILIYLEDEGNHAEVIKSYLLWRRKNDVDMALTSNVS